jgi:hypothetical protein
MASAAAVLAQIAPGLAGLDWSRGHAELYISTIRDEFCGGNVLPSSIIVAAGRANLELARSILLDWPKDDETEEE